MCEESLEKETVLPIVHTGKPGLVALEEGHKVLIRGEGVDLLEDLISLLEGLSHPIRTASRGRLEGASEVEDLDG